MGKKQKNSKAWAPDPQKSMRLSQHLCSEGTGKGIFETWQYLIIYFLDCFDSQHLYWNEVWVYIGEKKLTSDTSQARKDLNLTVSSSTRMAFTTDRTIPTPHEWPFTFHYKLQKPSCGAGDLMRLMDPASETWVAFTSMDIFSTGLSLLSIELLVGCPIGILNLNKNLSWNKRSNTVHHEVLQKPSRLDVRTFHFPPLKKKRWPEKMFAQLNQLNIPM